VGIADRAGMADIGRHVLSLGHRDIGILALPLGHRHETSLIDPVDPGPIPFTPTANRWAGLRDAGVVATAAAEAALSTVEEGMAAARLLLTLPDRPTAVVAFSDLLAAGAVIAARELGLRVPQDVSITGFDGIDLPWLAPDRLTTAAQPLMEKGRLTARAVAALVEGEATKYESLPVTVEIGTTTGPAPA
jgi:DNA-binding LacI/PurR family transcriptional regulator